MKNYKICFSVLLFSAGCSTADGITGFQKWKHPSTGKANLLADRKECERIAKGNHTYVSVESSASEYIRLPDIITDNEPHMIFRKSMWKQDNKGQNRKAPNEGAALSVPGSLVLGMGHSGPSFCWHCRSHDHVLFQCPVWSPTGSNVTMSPSPAMMMMAAPRITSREKQAGQVLAGMKRINN